MNIETFHVTIAIFILFFCIVCVNWNETLSDLALSGTIKYLEEKENYQIELQLQPVFCVVKINER